MFEVMSVILSNRYLVKRAGYFGKCFSQQLKNMTHDRSKCIFCDICDHDKENKIIYKVRCGTTSLGPKRNFSLCLHSGLQDENAI